MKFDNVKVGDKLTWVTQGTTWINGQPQERLLTYPAEVIEVFETTFICKTTDTYYLYKCNKSDGVAVGHGRECGWTEKVKTPYFKKVKPFFLNKNKNKKKPMKRILVASIFKRREVLGFIGGTVAVSLVGCFRGQSASVEPIGTETQTPTETTTTTASCMVKPQQTEGPYFVDEKLNRSDIRSDPTDGSVK